uniref:Uncharacterized protein n=1 Tax=Glossina brevipalpis TaxID=37001 RepID=A0A1A9WJP9_9MUSC
MELLLLLSQLIITVTNNNSSRRLKVEIMPYFVLDPLKDLKNRIHSVDSRRFPLYLTQQYFCRFLDDYITCPFEIAVDSSYQFTRSNYCDLQNPSTSFIVFNSAHFDIYGSYVFMVFIVLVFSTLYFNIYDIYYIMVLVWYYGLVLLHEETEQTCFVSTRSDARVRKIFMMAGKQRKFVITICCRETHILDSIVVSIPACHAGDRGSIPRRGMPKGTALKSYCRLITLRFNGIVM